MRQTFKIKFYCRPAKVRKTTQKAPVECSLIVNGDRQMITLPKDCKPSEFPTPDIKRYCTGVENKLNEIYTALSIAGKPITAYILKDIYLNGAAKMSYTLADMFADGLKLKMENASLVAYRKYELVSQSFLSRMSLNENREVESITHYDILSYKAKLDAEHKPQTVEKEMMRLKYFFNLAFNSGKINRNPFSTVKVPRAKTENIFLTEEEIEKIENLRIVEDRLDKVRDIFLFQCWTGLEYADLLHLVPEDIQKDGDTYYINKKRIKTGVPYFTVLFGRAKEIFDFYDGVLPIISIQKYDKYLKEIGKMAGISKRLVSLTARHSFATMALQRGLSMDIVSKLLGHVDTKMTKTYAALLDRTVLEAAKVATIKDKTTWHPTQKEIKEMEEDWKLLEDIMTKKARN